MATTNNNKIQLADGTVLLDLTDSTVSEETLLEGVSAYDASGTKITGTAVIPTKVSELENDVGYIYEDFQPEDCIVYYDPTDMIYTFEHIWEIAQTGRNVRIFDQELMQYAIMLRIETSDAGVPSLIWANDFVRYKVSVDNVWSREFINNEKYFLITATYPTIDGLQTREIIQPVYSLKDCTVADLQQAIISSSHPQKEIFLQEEDDDLIYYYATDRGSSRVVFQSMPVAYQDAIDYRGSLDIFQFYINFDDGTIFKDWINVTGTTTEERNKLESIEDGATATSIKIVRWV